MSFCLKKKKSVLIELYIKIPMSKQNKTLLPLLKETDSQNSKTVFVVKYEADSISLIIQAIPVWGNLCNYKQIILSRAVYLDILQLSQTQL